MQGLLMDEDLQGHVRYLVRLLDVLGLLGTLVDDSGLRFVIFPDLGLDFGMDDRRLWEFCQRDGWALSTENRNAEGEDSLQATLDAMWRSGDLSILTLSRKGRFQRHLPYARKAAEDIATVLFGIAHEGTYRDQPRIYVPFRWP